MKYYNFIWVFLLSVFGFASHNLQANIEFHSERVHIADAKKSQNFIHDGLIIGGDKAINGVLVKDVRRAFSAGSERIVIDLEGQRNGEPVGIPRPPYYQVAVSPEEQRLVLTLWGKPKFLFDAKKIASIFKKSRFVRNLIFYPVLDEESWTLVFELKAEYPIEVFELSNPTRIILDIRGLTASKRSKNSD
ncbi:MAG: hypothetical protein AABZ06_02845 [Bdellovibrionota bacterium]